MEENIDLLEILKSLSKEYLEFYIHELMAAGCISFADIAMQHTRFLEEIKKHDTEEMLQLRYKISDLWCGNKKDVPKKLVAYMQEFKDKGWINLSQEQIDNSKWNK